MRVRVSGSEAGIVRAHIATRKYTHTYIHTCKHTSTGARTSRHHAKIRDLLTCAEDDNASSGCRAHKHTHTNTYTCVCVCVCAYTQDITNKCVCVSLPSVRERERGREVRRAGGRERERERKERERETERERVCLRIFVLSVRLSVECSHICIAPRSCSAAKRYVCVRVCVCVSVYEGPGGTEVATAAANINSTRSEKVKVLGET